MRDDRDFVRQAAIEPDVALGLRPAHGVGEIPGRDFHIDITAVEAVMCERGLHHHDGGILGDGLGKAAGEGRQEVRHRRGMEGKPALSLDILAGEPSRHRTFSCSPALSCCMMPGSRPPFYSRS